MTAGVRTLKAQWTDNERKAANLDQRLKSLIMSVLPDDQMNFVISCETAKSILKDLILYHEGPSDVKENRVMDLKLCYNTFRFKEGETITQTFTRYKALMNELVNDGIKLSKMEINTGFIIGLPKKWLKESLSSATPLSTAFFSTSIVQDFQDNPDDEEDTRSSQEYMNDLELECHERALLAKSKRFFKKGTQRLSDEEEVLSDANDMVEVKVLMALADDESDVIGKESARNGEWVKISMRKALSNLTLNIGNVSKLNDERPWLSEAEGFNFPNHDIGRILPSESQIHVIDSSVTDYDSAKESTSVCSTSLNPMEKLSGAEPQTESQPGPKTIKSILKSCSTRKAETSKDVVKNEINNFSTLAKGNKNVSASKRNLAPTCKLKNNKTKDDIPMSVGKHHRASFKRKQTSSIKKCLHLLHMDLFGPVTLRSINHEKYTLVIADEYSSLELTMALNSEIAFLSTSMMKDKSLKMSPIFTHLNIMMLLKEEIELSKKLQEQCFQDLSFQSNIGLKLVFNTIRKQIEETYHITFDESTKVIKFSKPSVDDITIAESKRYPPDEYLHHLEPS
ncbi:hypothetical protein Tco_1508117 [Tanacetum coccineum]